MSRSLEIMNHSLKRFVHEPSTTSLVSLGRYSPPARQLEQKLILYFFKIFLKYYQAL